MNLYVVKNAFGYSALIKSKDENVSFMNLGFKKDLAPVESCLITVKNAFFTSYKDKMGNDKIKLVILDYVKA